jgi:hypothetical protein
MTNVNAVDEAQAREALAKGMAQDAASGQAGLAFLNVDAVPDVGPPVALHGQPGPAVVPPGAFVDPTPGVDDIQVNSQGVARPNAPVPPPLPGSPNVDSP